MNPTQVAQSEAERIAQIAAESANQFLQAGQLGITLFALIIAFALIILMFAMLWFLLRRSGIEREMLKKSSDTNNALAATVIEENKNSQESRAKQVDAIYKQTDSNDRLNGTIIKFIENQSLQGDTLDRLDVNVLKVVNGFGTLDEVLHTIESAVKNNPVDHASVLDALRNLATAQEKIFTLIDSRLPERAKTDTPTPMTLHPATEMLRKLRTDEVKSPNVAPPKPDEPKKDVS